MDISIKYDPKFVEEKIYHRWMKGNYFVSYPDNRIPYTILMPPPNITGILHIGHILNNTIQDVLIRHARMKGYNSCWIPGTDHASIATEAKVENVLKKQGLSKIIIGREKFLYHVLEWYKKHKDIIFNQLRKLGCSCDWNRTQFTMNKNLSQSITKIFIDLYERGYIYRGYHVVNWDPEARTTLSDEEVIYKEKKGKLFYIKYKIKGERNNYITVATTRPETIFGDTAVCFHPNDLRYSHLIKKKVIVPIINREIPVIQDLSVDPNFGTGCLKITPAHDINDKNIADKYHLDVINIFNEDATLNEKGLHYRGMDRFEVRKKIIEELSHLKSLVNIEENYNHKIGFSERTQSIIEQKLSLQWFLKMKKISLPAVEAVKKGKIKFHPSKFEKIYFQWMNKIRDWNISRQLWWGHRIPVYFYGKNNDDFVVAENLEEALKKARKKSKNKKLRSDQIWMETDVLDTWFSSWILPISVFDGIYNPNNQEISYYYPTEDLVTGSDILFFWVARMIIAGFFFQKERPFKNVYFTGIVRDSLNRKMSKSLNNSPNPMDLIEEYGADAVRMGIMLRASAGKDFHFEEKICLQGRNFSNKIWNAFRLIQNWKISNKKTNISESSKIALIWFENRFYYVLEILEKYFKEYKLDESLMILYKFIWNDFCSYFLEIIKPISSDNFISKTVYLNTIKYFENLLKLLHPYMPFITEKIWNLLKKRTLEEALIISPWPKKKSYNHEILVSFEKAIQIVSQIRHIRNIRGIPYKKKLVLFSINHHKKKCDSVILKLANLSQIIMGLKKPKQGQLFPFFSGKEKYFLSFIKDENDDLYKKMDVIQIEKKIQYFSNLLSMIRKNLSNKKYVMSVPKKILLKEKKKENDTIEKIANLKEYLKNYK
ncbi:valine--tRNA ligase [Blattabacterium cuenoti]|uniref:valine--tRNA ligase n=1 Tax=Blattabacterium cuenoti TaxID=1653831 RepID=UPI00163D26B3|nr:valine--tRNA ligase [Blattabacterium cuenoti]